MASYLPLTETNEMVSPDRRRGRGQPGSALGTPLNYSSVTAMEARLVAANAAYWTTARLNQTDFNSLVYAVRQLDDAAGIR